MVGPAFGSTFILGRTEVDPTETPVEMDNWIESCEWADSLGADIITSSLGYLEFDAPFTSYSLADMNGIQWVLKLRRICGEPRHNCPHSARNTKRVNKRFAAGK